MHENLKHENFSTPKFPDLRYAVALTPVRLLLVVGGFICKQFMTYLYTGHEAESHARGKGLGLESTRLMMFYGELLSNYMYM